ncbi:MAG TPA: Ohr family peroxiredoxin [Candidatus Didemnitutus sp.]|nr:Ohr family peroxiredoxin [Candidatus Didemnitutus sp.]
MKTIHAAEVVAEGGRDGKVETPSGSFSAELSTAETENAVTPEHLFIGAYSACFLGALKNAAETAHHDTDGFGVTGICLLEEEDNGGYRLRVTLRASMPGVDEKDAQRLLQRAHETCPYSKATRGNITVDLETD